MSHNPNCEYPEPCTSTHHVGRETGHWWLEKTHCANCGQTLELEPEAERMHQAMLEVDREDDAWLANAAAEARAWRWR